MSASFVHLHNHSEYSLLDGASRIKDLVKAAAGHKMKAVALTDHGNLFGAIKFYEAAWKEGIKPILGCEVYLTRGSRFDRGSTASQKQTYHHLTLLAKNEQGYRNLLRLVSLAYTEGFYYKPRVDKELLTQLGNNLFCLTGCLKGEVPYLLNLDQMDKARAALEEYRTLFDPDSLYLEIMENGLPEQKKANQGLMELASQMGLPLVATNDCHYIRPEDAEAHDILLCIQTGKTEDDPKRMKYTSREFYFKSPEQMIRAFDYAPEAVANTVVIADACNVQIRLGESKRPEYFLPPECTQTHEDYLRQLVYEGAAERYGELTEEIRKRIDYELSVIVNMRYESYFLIVWDFIHYARGKGISVGPGRGSAAGSIVAYCLGITDLDPLEHGLLFERFLNPERVSMPDIDVDFADKRREEVIHYVSRKYGQESVAQIATFGTMGAKMVVRDVGRALGYPAAECDRVAKMIPNDLGTTLEDARKKSEELREWIATDRRNERLFNIALSLEGLARQVSTHAAGIVIANGDLRDFAPLMKSQKGEIACQFEMKAIEKLGLLKMDFLGLRTLSIIDDALDLLRQRGVELDLKKVPLDDPATYALLSDARTSGVFQLESSGMKDILKKLRPGVFSDIVAVLALYRPGPLGSGMVDDFINRKHGRVPIEYDHPDLEPILKETYGIILYQEQVMKIANVISGFTLGQADMMRRAMGKKDQAQMDKLQSEFVQGAANRGVAKAVAEKLWRLINYFAGYGFNKSHSAAYAVLSYQTAYLKAHYPAEFMASLLTNEINNTDRVVRLANDCRAMGIRLLPPCVKESESHFTVRDGRILYGLSGIKNVGVSAVRSIVASRKKGGPFKSLLDFCERVDLSSVNSKVLESLVRAGAMDCLGKTRASLLAQLPEAQERALGLQRDRAAGQISLFQVVDCSSAPELPEIDLDEMPEHELLKSEKQLLGIYLSGHPLSEHATELALFSSATTAEIAEREEPGHLRICGVITQIARKNTRNGDRMAILTIEDMEGQLEVVVFPDLFRENVALFQEESILVVQGNGERRGDQVSIRATDVWSLEQAREKLIRAVHVHLRAPGLEQDHLLGLRERVQRYRGNARLVLHVELSNDDEVIINAGDQFTVRPGPLFEQAIGEVFSEPRVSYDLNGNGNGHRSGNGARNAPPRGRRNGH